MAGKEDHRILLQARAAEAAKQMEFEEKQEGLMSATWRQHEAKIQGLTVRRERFRAMGIHIPCQMGFQGAPKSFTTT